MLEVGTKAPEFTLKNQAGEEVRLSDFLGKKVVLYFYPRDNTPGCTRQAQAFARSHEAFGQKNTVVIGISKDSAASHLKFAQKYDLPFLLLSDPELQAIQAYGAGDLSPLHSERPWIVVAPTYGWQLPRLLADHLRQTPLTGSREVWFVLTCGSEIGAAGRALEDLCRELGLHYRGVWEVVMPENYIAMFSAPDRAEAQKIVDRAKPGLLDCAGFLRRGEAFPPRRTGPLDRLKSGAVNRIFYRYFIKADPFFVKDSCIGCGSCVKACPLNNIVLQGGRPFWGTDCTHCMACICTCPAQAIEYGNKSRGKPRYQCPEEG